MRVGIGAVLGIVGGPATYARALVRALARAGGHQYVVFTDRPAAFSGVETVHVPLRGPWTQPAWDHGRLPGLLAAHRLDVYHGTKNVLPWRLPVRAVVTVHDLAVYACPETFAWPQRWHFRLCVPPSVRRAARVITDSEHARSEIVAHLGIGGERVRVVPLGADQALHAAPAPGAVEAFRAARGLGPRLVTCVGTLQPRKHVERVVEAFTIAGGAARGWELVLAGRRRPGYRPTWLDGLPAGVRWLGALPDEEICLLHAAAEIAVSGSDYEGFGLAILEAMASGCAVVAVAASAVPEVVGDAGVLVARSDPMLIAASLAPLLAEPAARAALAARARARAAGFTWEETARRTRAVYEEAAACG